ncbi:hypothetical protein PSACC_03257 [Paramicrosporidium saccamoebae]|uniref:Thioredoxin domain-containing protein n=1 Tax=Paramicrosporidium saccamoebae TaxID=1246581 RepID=A0A2H9TGJ9_9FUNG|nr:hypothetical protein PSACC_03257 [Paramicrosporidium saccamoebae]
MYFLSLLSICILVAHAAQDLYLGEKLITKLTDHNFQKTLTTPKPVLVKFYNPGCPHCTRMVSAWRQVASHFEGHMVVGAVNCATQGVCGKYGVNGVPDVRLFIKGPKGEPVPIKYEGNRTKDSIVGFAKPYLLSYVHKVSDSKKTGVKSLDAFLKTEAGLPHVIIFKQGKLVPSMGYMTLSVDFKEKYSFGIVNLAIDADIPGKLGVTLPKDTDSLVFIAPGEKKGELYPGKNSFIEMKAYLQKQITKEEKSEL